MDKFTWFLLASGFCLSFFLLLYRLLLRKLTHFHFNRAYLLLSLGLSLLLPWPAMQSDLFPDLFTQNISIDNESSSTVPTSAMLPSETGKLSNSVPQTDLAPIAGESPAIIPTPLFAASPWLAYAKWSLWLLYFVGLAFGLAGFMKSLYQVVRLYRQSPKQKEKNRIMVFPKQIPGSFSFFKMIFLSPIDRVSPDRSCIEAHEEIHLRQYHSLDILFAEVASRIWWFLPWTKFLVTYFRETHEYLADEAASINKGKVAYSRLLLSQILQPSKALPVHYFALSKTQKRIIMLHQTPSSLLSKAKYLAIIPVLFLAFSFLAFLPPPTEPISSNETINSTQLISFSGEEFPRQKQFQAGLKKRIVKLKSRPAYAQKLYFRGLRFATEIRPLLKSQGIPSDFFYLAMAESALDRSAVSSMGACGIWQFMPATAQNYGLVIEGNRDDRQDLQSSTRSAAAYLKEQFAEFRSWTAAAVAYNRGPLPLRKISFQNGPETWYKMDHERGYLYQILTMKKLMESPETFGIQEAEAFGHPLPRTSKWETSSEFGPRKSPLDGKIKNHDGVDFKAPMDTKVYAIENGMVESTEISDQGRGNSIIISHSSPLSSHYNHLNQILIKSGQKVKKGDLIGTVGNSGRSMGPHLHLEIREADLPVDPALYLKW